MNISDLIPFLDRLGVRPKKSLSQNFLIDPNIVHKIVQLANIKPGDRVLEIGPGPGALTAALLETGAYVTAVEKDTVFARELHRLQKNGRLEVIEADFLNWNIARFDHAIGNIPYSITTPILEKICASEIPTFTFMAQKEFAARIMAKPGTKEIGSLSIFIQSHADIAGSFEVSRNCFMPIPKVDSTVMKLNFKGSRDPDDFFALVRRAFQQRRKMMTTSLKGLYDQERIREALTAAKATVQARPEILTLEQWRIIFQNLKTSA